QAAAKQTFRVAPGRQRHYHDRARNRRCTVPRLRAGAPRRRREGAQLAVFRRPSVHPRFPLSAGMAGCVARRRTHAHGCGLLARPAGKSVRPAPDLGTAPRCRRLARGRRVLLRVRRRQCDGKGRADGAGARLCGREGARSGRRRAGGARDRARQALFAGCVLSEPSRNERIKEASDYLRGTLAEGMREAVTGAIIEDDAQLLKFHGMYLQDDRDLRAERTRKKMEKAFAFMLRVRIPGGVLTPAQWLALDEIGRHHGNGTLRITTRQTIQLHGVIKSNVKQALRHINEALLTTIAACGDVNRNVICNPNPHTQAHAAVMKTARAVSDYLLPRTPAYREIWLDGEKIAGG